MLESACIEIRKEKKILTIHHGFLCTDSKQNGVHLTFSVECLPRTCVELS